MIRWCLVAMLLLASAAGSMAAPDASDKAPASPDQVFTDVMRQSIGAPMKADLGPEAAVRLHEDLLLVPHDPAVRLLTVQHKTIPADFLAMLAGPAGVETPGYVRFVPSGFVDSNEALAWTRTMSSTAWKTPSNAKTSSARSKTSNPAKPGAGSARRITTPNTICSVGPPW